MTELDLMQAWARAFAVTLGIELIVAPPLLGRRAAALGRRLAVVTFAQLVSHPVLWFVLPSLIAPRSVYLVVAELWAWLSEAALYSVALPRLDRSRAIGASLAANVASLGIGLGLRVLGLAV